MWREEMDVHLKKITPIIGQMSRSLCGAILVSMADKPAQASAAGEDTEAWLDEAVSDVLLECVPNAMKLPKIVSEMCSARNRPWIDSVPQGVGFETHGCECFGKCHVVVHIKVDYDFVEREHPPHVAELEEGEERLTLMPYGTS